MGGDPSLADETAASSRRCTTELRCRQSERRLLDDLDAWRTQVDCSSLLEKEVDLPLLERGSFNVNALLKEIRNES